MEVAESATDKAIARLKNTHPAPPSDASEEEWEEYRARIGFSTEIELGTEIDKDELLKRLRSAGVKV